MNSKREQLVNLIAELNAKIEEKKEDATVIQLQNETAKFKANKVLNEKEMKRLQQEIDSLQQQIDEAEKELRDLKRFKRELCIENIEYLLGQSNKKLGALEKESGNTPGYISRMKKGTSGADPSIEFLMTAAEEFCVPLEMLVSSKMSEMTATEKYILDFLRKVTDDTGLDNIVWKREMVQELEKLNVQYEYTNEPYVEHPLYVVEEGRLPDDSYVAIAKYNSLFFKGADVKPCGDCYHAKLFPTDRELYIMECERRGDGKELFNGRIYYELYIVTNGTASKLCNTEEVSAPIATMINTLNKTIKVAMTHVHIDDDVMDAIDSYMNGMKTCPEREIPFIDDEELPFN